MSTTRSSKTKQVDELLRFINGQPIMLMLKLDGLTVKLTYDHGELQEAATRGNGDEGEIITHNAAGIIGIPAKIPHQERLVLAGEAFIRPSDFERLKGRALDSNGEPYKNGRNLAVGSVRLLDAAVCKQRSVTFMAFNVVEGLDECDNLSDKLYVLNVYGVPVCPHLVSKSAITKADLETAIGQLRDFAQKSDIPIDGIVAKYNNVAYGISSYPSYTLKTQRDGTVLFQKSRSVSYEEAAEAARAIIDNLAGKTESEKLYAFACYVCDRLEYDESSTATPRALFATDGVKKGNCMSYAHGFQYMCNLANIPCILVHSDVHQWNEVYTNGRWYSVDLTGFKIGYSERGSATLLHDSSELIGSIYTQSEPQLTRFAKELCVPNSTK